MSAYTGHQTHLKPSPAKQREEEAMDASPAGGFPAQSANGSTDTVSPKSSSHMTFSDDAVKVGCSEKSSSSVSSSVGSSKTSTFTMSSNIDASKASTSMMSATVDSSKASTSAMSPMTDAPEKFTSTMTAMVESPKTSRSTMGSMIDMPKTSTSAMSPIGDSQASSTACSGMDLSTVESMFKALDINVVSANDKICPDPDDCTVLKCDGEVVLIITDYINESVRAVYQHEGNVHTSTRKLNHRPHSVTKLTETKIAVCYWMHNQITILKVSEDIEFDKTVSTRKDYNCVAPLGKGQLIAGCSDLNCVDIINMSGKILKNFDGYGNRKYHYIIDKPRSMCVTKAGHTIVTDGGSKSVYCLTSTGEVVFQYLPEDKERQLHWPRGVAVTEHDYILFADCYTNKIIQISHHGIFIRDVLTSKDGISHPHGLCIHGHDLYVTQEENNIVKKFDISGIEYESVLESSRM